MKNKIYKYTLLCAIGCLFQLPNAFSQDCNFEFNYQTIKVSDNSFTFSVVPKSASGTFNFKLYDLIEGKVIAEKQSISGLTSQNIEFKDVKPSTYTVYITKVGCRNSKTLGGIEGISLTSER